MDVQIKNFERGSIHTEMKRKRESSELLEKYLKTFDDLNVAYIFYVKKKLNI